MEDIAVCLRRQFGLYSVTPNSCKLGGFDCTHPSAVRRILNGYKIKEMHMNAELRFLIQISLP